MVLGELSQSKPQIRQTPVKQRVISETTGLVKFNINSSSTPSKTDPPTPSNDENQRTLRLQTPQPLNPDDRFLSASSPSHSANGLSRSNSISPKRGIQVIPNKMIKPTISVTDSGPSNITSYRNYQQNTRSRTNSQVSVSSSEMIQSAQAFSTNQDIYLQFAAKQREVLELKFQMQNLKDQLTQAEGELKEIERLCGERSSQIPMNSSQRPPQQQQQQPSNTGSGASNLLARSNSTISSLKNRQSISNLLSSVSLNSNSLAEEDTNNPFNFQNLKKRISTAQFPTSSFNKLQQDTGTFLGKSLEFMNTIKDEVFREIHSDIEEEAFGPENTSANSSLLMETERGTFLSKPTAAASALNRMKSMGFDPTTNSNGRVKYAQEVDYESDEGEDMELTEGDSSMLSEYGGADVSDFTLAVK
ncbi:hypothetical protein WICPIJ_004642 [Wickerhamomyces pijperi]|uniref:Uncharacterized protein n=1 Tax=Wickerhamomyces pijperi TaxID=599730 RepID=A0A9P8Q7H9_WICPI|nr:hypothetical protein WICPIJ_004642 [Wickerhamomyces pijperi]